MLWIPGNFLPSLCTLMLLCFFGSIDSFEEVADKAVCNFCATPGTVRCMYDNKATEGTIPVDTLGGCR